jgi:hypothetical protein
VEVNLINGVVNVPTGLWRDRSPDDVFFTQLPFAYNPDVICSAIDTFISEVLAEPNRELALCHRWKTNRHREPQDPCMARHTIQETEGHRRGPQEWPYKNKVSNSGLVWAVGLHPHFILTNKRFLNLARARNRREPSRRSCAPSFRDEASRCASIESCRTRSAYTHPSDHPSQCPFGAGAGIVTDGMRNSP